LGVVKTTLRVSKVATAAAVKMKSGGEQVNGRERETATLFGNLRGYFRRAFWRFRATSSPPLDASCLKTQSTTDLKTEQTRFAFLAKLRGW